MIQLLNGKNLTEIQKELPKRLSHLKEKVKILFIKECVSIYRKNEFGIKINFNLSTYENGFWNMSYVLDKNISLRVLVESIMSHWYFSNLDRNENVYFYRFLNVFRSLLSQEEWKEVESYLLDSNDNLLSKNTKEYCSYRSKLREIKILIGA